MHAPIEKMIAIPVPGETWALEGVFLGAPEGEDEPGGAVIAPPHPLYGGSLESPVASELAFACQQAGYAITRFNWRGVGASGGTPSGENDAADADYRAALASVVESVDGPLIAAGYSFGAASALRCGAANPRVRRLLLVAPPPSLLDAQSLSAFRGRVLVLVGSEDTLAPHAALARLLGEENPRRRLEVIPDADHFFGVGLREIGHRTRSWLDGS